MKKSLAIATLVVASLFLTTNVYAQGVQKCTQENISSGMCFVDNTLTIDASSQEITIGSTIMVKKGSTLTITGSNKVTITTPIIVSPGGELIIDASDVVVTANQGLVQLGGKLTIKEIAKIDASDKTLIQASNGAEISLNGDIKAKILVDGKNNTSVAGQENTDPVQVVVEGGTYNITDMGFRDTSPTHNYKQNVTIKNGDFSNVNNLFGTTSENIEGEITIIGGKFNNEDGSIKPEYIENGYELNEDGSVNKIKEAEKTTTTTTTTVTTAATTTAQATTTAAKTSNPKTLDSILTYVSLGILSMTVIAFAGYKTYKKVNN